MAEQESASTQPLNWDPLIATANASHKSRILLVLASIKTKEETSHWESTLCLDTLAKEVECLVVRQGSRDSSGEGITVLVLRTTRFLLLLGKGVRMCTNSTIDFILL